MRFELFQALGESLDNQYKAANYNEDTFIDLAEKALQGFDFDYQWDALAIAEFASKSKIKMTFLDFSNLPLTVYRGKGFYIEILTWTKGTTNIHQHSFNGAFKVLHGSSIHSIYQFNKQLTINYDFYIGDVVSRDVEYLSKGDIRQIRPGDEGLTHSLYHLDHPSATLVIRTNGHYRHIPQLEILPPNVSYSELGLGNDTQVKFYNKLIASAQSVNRENLIQLMMQHISQLDYARMFKIIYDNAYLLSSSELDEFYQNARKCHGDLVDVLIKVMARYNTISKLTTFRQHCEDAELRFFMALLMNVTDKKALYQLVGQQYPDVDPVMQCASWLERLSEQRVAIAKKFFHYANQSGMNDLRVGADVAESIPVGLKEKNEFFMAALSGENNKSDWNKSIVRLKSLPELQALFQ